MDRALQQQIGPVVAYLLGGVLDRVERPVQWAALHQHRAHVIDYLDVIGLHLEIEESEGYAYLRQHTEEESQSNGNDEPHNQDAQDGQAMVPRLIRRRALSYPVSLLCVLLRKQLIESDTGGEQRRLIVTRDQIGEMLQVFLPTRNNQARVVDQIDAHIKKVVDLGFLKRLKNQPDTYEVRRILRALVDANWLAGLDEKLKEYRDHAEPPE